MKRRHGSAWERFVPVANFRDPAEMDLTLLAVAYEREGWLWNTSGLPLCEYHPSARQLMAAVRELMVHILPGRCVRTGGMLLDHDAAGRYQLCATAALAQHVQPQRLQAERLRGAKQ